MPRVSSKDKYIAQTFELFKREGLSLNMEQIAVSLGLTKKTLYNNFTSKENLINSVLDYFFKNCGSKQNRLYLYFKFKSLSQLGI